MAEQGDSVTLLEHQFACNSGKCRRSEVYVINMGNFTDVQGFGIRQTTGTGRTFRVGRRDWCHTGEPTMERGSGTRSTLGERERTPFRSSPRSIAPIRARLLGSTDLRVGDRILTGRDWPRRQARSILLQLLGTPGHRLPRDVVLDAHWPDQDLSASLNSLYKSLHALRRTLEPGLERGRESVHIDVGNDHIALAIHDGLWVDVDRFDLLVRQADLMDDPRDTLRSALALYRGEFVADEPYVDWPVTRREALRAARVRVTLKLAQLDMAADDPSATLGYLEGLLASEPAFEEAHRAIVRALLASGQRGLALQQLERCRFALHREFGTEPDDETRELEVWARAITGPAANVTAQPIGAPRFGLPGLPTATIGRAEDMFAVRSLLHRKHTRLVTIVGPGGVGKTRLATEMAWAADDDFPDGVAFVDLTGIRNTALVLPSILAVLNIPVSPGRPAIDTIAKWLAVRPRFLLVLDNLEHLAGVDQLMAKVLASVPSLTVLATSRQPVRIRAEWVYRLEPLAVPEKLLADGPIRDIASVRLFLQVSHAWGGNGTGTTDDDLADIAVLCRKLEGIPLAIELAAARTWELSPAAILAALDERFIVLRDGPRDLPARHRALEATIGWSYGLLSGEEQLLFRGLAVFAGGVETDALLEVFGDYALPLAERLAEKSLARWTWRNGSRRLDMLETTRAYALNALEAAGESSAVQLSHARFFANLAVRSGFGDAKQGEAQIAWTRRLERDQENIHQALANCFALGESDTALIITNVMGSYWNTHLPSELARTWIEQALAMEPDGCHLSAGWTAMWGATCAWQMADTAAMLAFEERARSIWTALGSPQGLAWVDYSVASRLGLQSHHAEARRLHESNLRVFRQAGDFEGIVKTLCGLSCALRMMNQPVAAVAVLDEALTLSCEHDNLVLQSYVLSRLSTALLADNQAQRAADTAVECERVARLVGDRLSLPWVSLVYASLSYNQRNFDDALTHARAALAGFREVGDNLNEWSGSMACVVACVALGRLGDARKHAFDTIRSVQVFGGEDDMATSLPELADLLLACDQPDESMATFAAGLTIGERLGVVTSDSNKRRYQAGIATARRRLGETAATGAWELGTGMAAAETLERARNCLSVVAPRNG